MELYAFTKEEQQKLRRGEIVAIGNKRYGLCRECGSVVCLNKTLFGSVHICA